MCGVLLAIAANATASALAPHNDEGKGRQDSRKIGLIEAIPMRPPEAGCTCPAMAVRVGVGSAAVCRGAGRSRRDECFSASATRGRWLTQDRANHGNRGKAIRGGIATFSLGELNSAGGSVFRTIQQQTVTFRSASRRQRCGTMPQWWLCCWKRRPRNENRRPYP